MNDFRDFPNAFGLENAVDKESLNRCAVVRAPEKGSKKSVRWQQDVRNQMTRNAFYYQWDEDSGVYYLFQRSEPPASVLDRNRNLVLIHCPFGCGGPPPDDDLPARIFSTCSGCGRPMELHQVPALVQHETSIPGNHPWYCLTTYFWLGNCRDCRKNLWIEKPLPRQRIDHANTNRSRTHPPKPTRGRPISLKRLRNILQTDGDSSTKVEDNCHQTVFDGEGGFRDI